MKSVSVIFLIIFPALVFADSLVESIGVTPENPDPMQPFRIGVVVAYPIGCWEEGPVGDLEFTVVDLNPPGGCPGGIYKYWVLFEQEGLAEGYHSVTVTELHESDTNPESWDHVVEFTVGNPPVVNDSVSWSSIKAIFR